MADFPSSIFTPRTTENLPGISYDATKTKVGFAEDYSLPAAEIAAIEATLGTNPQGAYATVKDWLLALAAGGSSAWGSITGTLSDQTDLQSALDAKQNALGFTAENVANKSTSTSLGTSDTLYPSQKAVKTYVDSAISGLASVYQTIIGYTPENVANKSTNVVTDQASNTKYPSVKAVYDWAVATFQTALGYTPENVANKSTAIALGTSNTLYPTQNAVKKYVDNSVPVVYSPLTFWQRLLAGITWTARSAAQANTLDYVAWSPTLKLFVMVSENGTNQVQTSPDGINWTVRTASAVSSWSFVMWCPDLALFIASSYSGSTQIMTSPDGINWTSRTASAAAFWNSIAWSPSLNLLVAVSDGGGAYVMTSPDGITWTSRTPAANNLWFSVAWSPALSLFVAVALATSSNIMTSPDGVTWTLATTPEANAISNVCWSPELGLFVAICTNGTHRVFYSSNGTSWSLATAAEAGIWKGLCWSPELRLFVAVNDSSTNRIMTSPDGINWTAVLAPGTNSWTSVCWSPLLGIFVACAYSGTNRVMTSGLLQTSAADWAATVHAASSKTTPVDADELGIVDSAASNTLAKLTWANLKATLKTYFDTLYTGGGYTLLGNTTISAPANATTYFFGASGFTGGTSAGFYRMQIPRNGQINAISVENLLGGAAASGETSTINMKILTGANNVIFNNTFLNTTQAQDFLNTSLAINVTAGQYIEFNWVTPTWATRPTTSVILRTIVYIKIT